MPLTARAWLRQLSRATFEWAAVSSYTLRDHVLVILILFCHCFRSVGQSKAGIEVMNRQSAVLFSKKKNKKIDGFDPVVHVERE